MRPFKHSKSSSDAGCSCSVGKIMLIIAVAFIAAYGIVIASILTPKSSEIPLPPVESQQSSEKRLSTSAQVTVSTNNEDRIESSSHASSSMSSDAVLDSITAVVECKTTHGPITIDVRENWGPLGASQYLSLVDQDFFTELPFFRVAPRYITQFGAKLQQPGHQVSVQTIADDKSLWGKRDMDFGYLFFAGSGPNSRHDQMVLALCEQAGCIQTALGKAPWEVPIGTVREENFDTLKSIMKTGFPYPKLEMPSQHKNAKGPNQGKIRSDPSYLSREYPDMAYWQECKVVRRNINIPSPVKTSAKTIPVVSSIPATSSASPSSSTTYVRFNIDLVHETLGNDSPANVRHVYFVVEVRPEWAPLGAQRFLELVDSNFFDNSRFFRAIKGFMAQFGIAADPKVSQYWRKKAIPDDPVIVSNERGYLTYAMAGKNTRTSQLFINFKNNAFLDKQNFAPFGRVVEGLETGVDAIYTGYGEGGNGRGTDGKGPNQNMINNKGEPYLQELFPKLSIIRSVVILKDYSPPAAGQQSLS